MKPLQTSSGDPNADRRADYAEMLVASGDHAAAAELLLGGLELAPQWAMGWFRLGEMQEASGRLDLAAQAWRTALKLDPADRQGAALKLQLIGKGPVFMAPPSAFVETLFDHYAETFETMLVGKLDYRLPEVLDAAIRKARPGRFRLALDLGCGTGLMGEKLRPIVDRLEGFDISARMLKKARAKGIYDALTKADLQDFSYSGDKADLVTSADVLIYIGGLEGLVGTVAGLLAEGGLFVFSVESLAEGGGEFALQPSRRYAHSDGYVVRTLEANCLSVLALEPTTIRWDRREPVKGLAVVAWKAGPL
ncbi:MULTISPECIES: methyltransferase domain-containing protein [unclassified Mesorhizobium]|uniref:methyltransferase domain-containing protein n=1 Tax=unclassified Mesorhizobium TaxID=325217 RepID=UPI001CCBAABF|nr:MULTISPECIES: methyltransferase domain-containing protein [unclassified Mesorhizobium]MBZ9683085.1 methyltransferase domain-containing protein [Mesorhizobium sp. CO1-1-2]MBZ9924385.1 methyltransferase domain-containing protein [Mesorhizobium sp. BR1-1-4]